MKRGELLENVRGGHEKPKDEDERYEYGRDAVRSVEWLSTVVFGVGMVLSVGQIAVAGTRGGEWFALVLTSIGFVSSLALAIANTRRGHDRQRRP